MSCTRGKANPDRQTQFELFAASGGYCQNPSCERALFIKTDSKRIHIAEIAHIFAAGEKGPRAKAGLSEAERGAFDNLILLCPTCHTIVDKAPGDYPDELIVAWKLGHAARVAQLFGAVVCGSRQEVWDRIEPLLAENRALFEQNNPDKEYRQNPESEEAVVWQRAMRGRILPSNRRILAMLDVNRHHMIGDERETLELFRQHVHALEARHVTGIVSGNQQRFPPKMTAIMSTEG